MLPIVLLFSHADSKSTSGLNLLRDNSNAHVQIIIFDGNTFNGDADLVHWSFYRECIMTTRLISIDDTKTLQSTNKISIELSFFNR